MSREFAVLNLCTDTELTHFEFYSDIQHVLQIKLLQIIIRDWSTAYVNYPVYMRVSNIVVWPTLYFWEAIIHFYSYCLIRFSCLLQTELEEIETRNEQYPMTRAMLSVIDTLTDLPIPDALGTGYRFFSPKLITI